ncbi:MAG: fructosamine kinase family protein, partial [Myxococcales bacterium]|nr:fructosamine kinase family protein [Myxococcales bacterium]
MRAELRAAVGRALDGTVGELRALGGGSINQAWAAILSDGRRVFVKTNDDAPADMFAVEARGLAWLAEGAGGLRIPAVLAVDETFLVLELLEPGRPVGDFEERLGRGLAELHRSGASLPLGLDH